MKRSRKLLTSTSLIHRLATAGDISAAYRRLVDTPLADTTAWNALISGCSKNHLMLPAFHFFHQMRSRKLSPDAFSLSSLLKASSSNGDLMASTILHGLAVKLGLSSNAYVATGLMDNYSKAGDLGCAEKCFEECLVFESGVWTGMISGYARNGEYNLARELFVEMWHVGLDSNEFCLTSILAALTDGGFESSEGKQVHCLSLKMGFLSGWCVPLNNALLNMYCKFGAKDDGLRAFGEILEPDVVTWSTLIGVLDSVEALKLFRFLCSRSVEANEYTVINVLATIDRQGLLVSGLQIQARCFKTGFRNVVSVGNSFITMYGSFQQIRDAEEVFDEMQKRDIVSWNALIAAYAANGLPESAFGLFSQMQHSLVEPDTSTYVSILDAVSWWTTPNPAMQIHASIMKLGQASSDCMVTTLITVYGKCNGIKESEQVYAEAVKKTPLHVNAMASTFVQLGYYLDVLKLFQGTRNDGMEVDNICLSLVLKACCGSTSIEQGRSLHSLAVQIGISHSNFFGSAMIDVYAKCGSLDDAVKLFRELPTDNLATWNAMITGYAQHGCYNEVTDLFRMMAGVDIEPDGITFLGVLYACCHSGHVKEAHDYLNSMLGDYAIVPSLEHYSCVIDLLGRVGHLEEAKRSIEFMPFSPDARIWQTFLMACNLHGNTELGKVAAEELIKLEPDNDSAFVVLSHIYAAKGMWDEVKKLRREIKERAICKEPGCSWIQVEGTVHSFFANDVSHPETIDIHLVLKELNKLMRVVQYVGVDCSIQELIKAGENFSFLSLQ